MKAQHLLTGVILAAGCGNGDANLFSGTIEIDDVRISARVGGQVNEYLIAEGDAVEEGQLLLKIDDLPYTLVLEQSEAAFAASQANLETLLQGNREQQVLAASSSAEAARATMVQSESDLLRATELAAAGAISEQSLQAAQTAAVQAEQQYSSAIQAYSLAVEGARQTEIQAAEAMVESALAGVEMSTKQLEWTAVKSPLAGTVTGTNALAGENVPAGTTLLTIASLDTVRVVFYLSEPLLGDVHTGDRLTVTTDGGDSAEGLLVRIADTAEFTPSTVETRDGRTSLVYRAEGMLPNPAGAFKAGMPVDVRVETL